MSTRIGRLAGCESFCVVGLLAAVQQLTPDVRALADKQYALLKANPAHPSLRFKKVGRFWSARVSERMRALAVESGDDLVWFWIGDQHEYDRIIKKG